MKSRNDVDIVAMGMLLCRMMPECFREIRVYHYSLFVILLWILLREVQEVGVVTTLEHLLLWTLPRLRIVLYADRFSAFSG